MKRLVYLKSTNDEPYTTSDILAEYTQNSYRSVQKLIEKQMKRLEAFGRVRFEITPFRTRGGVQNKKIFYLNEQQSTLLISFMKNNEVVADFKVELVRQFFAMRKELIERKEAMKEFDPMRIAQNNLIKAMPDSPHKKFKYKHFTDLAYKIALGKNAKQIKAERGTDGKTTACNLLCASEIKAVAHELNKISVMIELGMEYTEIKERLSR